MNMPAEDVPVTRAQLTADLVRLGVEPGLTVMVHTSLRSLGWVVGGEQAVLEALRDAVGEAGTLVMPTQSWQLCDPAFLDITPAAWWPTIRDHLPVYSAELSPTRTMGAVAELFRTVPGTLRSAHPHRSISAKRAERRHHHCGARAGLSGGGTVPAEGCHGLEPLSPQSFSFVGGPRGRWPESPARAGRCWPG